MKWSFAIILTATLLLSSCSNPTGSSQAYVGAEAGPVEVTVSVDNTGKVAVSGGIVPKFTIGLGPIDLKVGVQETMELTSERSYYLFVIWQDETGEVKREEYEIGKTFHVKFTQNELIQEIQGNNNSVIVVVNKPKTGFSTSMPVKIGYSTSTPKADIFGNVVDSEGYPIEGINLAINQGDQRVDVYSGVNGSFSTYLPSSTNPIWNVQVVGIKCSSRVMNNCMLTGYFELTQGMNVTLPLSKPITFIFEKATTMIKGKVPASGIRIFANRSDGASSWGQSLNDGTFELPASDGIWDVYAANLNPYQEGEHISLEIINGQSNFVNLKIP